MQIDKIIIFYLDKLLHIFEVATRVGAIHRCAAITKTAKLNGFSDRGYRKNSGILQLTKFASYVLEKQDCPSLQMVDTPQGLNQELSIAIQLWLAKMNLSSLIRNLF